MVLMMITTLILALIIVLIIALPLVATIMLGAITLWFFFTLLQISRLFSEIGTKGWDFAYRNHHRHVVDGNILRSAR